MTLWLNMLDAWNLWYFKNVECGCLFLARTNSKKKNWKSSNHWYHKIIISKMFKIDIFKTRNQALRVCFKNLSCLFLELWSTMDRSDPKKNQKLSGYFNPNLTIFYTNIFWYLQTLRSFFLGRQNHRQINGRTDETMET